MKSIFLPAELSLSLQIKVSLTHCTVISLLEYFCTLKSAVESNDGIVIDFPTKNGSTQAFTPKSKSLRMRFFSTYVMLSMCL